jgi:hypothetical protein
MKFIIPVFAFWIFAGVGFAQAEQLSESVTSGKLKVENLNPEEKKEVLREVLKSGKQLKLTNFVTKQVEVIEDPYGMTREDALKYLPQIPEIVQIFDIYAQDNPPYAALIKSYGDLQKML